MKKILRSFILALSLVPLFSSAQNFSTQTLIDSLSLPIAFDFAPDGRIFLTEKGNPSNPYAESRIRLYDASFQDLGVFYDLSDSAHTTGECGLLGLVLDPAFATNHYVYVYYTHVWNTDQRIRILRLTDVNNSGTSPAIIFDHNAPDSLFAHVAGNLHFRPSEPNNIYFVIGERTIGSNAQLLNNPYGKVLRITTSGGIPTDNPFYDDGNPLTGNNDCIWSYGHRNPYDFCFGPNDSLYISENGALAWDEVDVGHKGANYGWPACEGAYVTASTTQPCNTPGFTDPIAGWNPTVGLTGIVYYTGSVLPGLDNHLLVGDFNTHNIYDVTLGNGPAFDTALLRTTWISNAASSGITGMKQGPEGCLYGLAVNFFPAGNFFRICPDGVSTGGEHVLSAPLFVSPNPAGGLQTIRYALKEPASVSISVRDLRGKLVLHFSEGQKAAGNHTQAIDWDQVTLDAGIYFCTLEAGEAHQTIKLVHTK
ncbi:MAG: glucose/sorbosone dehydrogenase [Bacteroidetes bacterium]|nr:MAG: glucose/sorbosone dehydrogenase [Bacteroidota bacterium]